MCQITFREALLLYARIKKSESLAPVRDVSRGRSWFELRAGRLRAMAERFPRKWDVPILPKIAKQSSAPTAHVGLTLNPSRASVQESVNTPAPINFAGLSVQPEAECSSTGVSSLAGFCKDRTQNDWPNTLGFSRTAEMRNFSITQDGGADTTTDGCSAGPKRTYLAAPTRNEQGHVLRCRRSGSFRACSILAFKHEFCCGGYRSGLALSGSQ
jgi:hypothetical protein